MYIPKMVDRNCPICKKYFLVTDMKAYIYKVPHNNRIKIMCSYTCFRKLKKSKKKIMEVSADE